MKTADRWTFGVLSTMLRLLTCAVIYNHAGHDASLAYNSGRQFDLGTRCIIYTISMSLIVQAHENLQRGSVLLVWREY